MSSTKSHVAVATNMSNIPSQKEYNTEEPLGRQNSFGNNRRGNMKGKHLTRSHAMREATSPPRTPTPRGDNANLSSNSLSPSYQHHHGDTNDNANTNGNNNKLHAQSATARGNSPIVEAPAVIVTSQQQNVALTNETEFPKLTPPKSSKCGNGGGNQKNNNNSSNNTNANTNGAAVEGTNKAEYNNNNNHNSNSNSNNTNSNNGKKVIVDMKTNANNNAQDAHKSNSNNNNNNSNSNNNKHHQQSYYNNNNNNNMQQTSNTGNENVARNQQASTAAAAAGGGAGAGAAGGGAANTSSTTTTIYNSGMNYQLNTTDTNTTANQQQVTYDKENNRCPRNDNNQNNSLSNTHDDDQHYERGSGSGGNGGNGGNKKHRTNSNSKSSKPRLKNMGSSGSVEVFNNSENSGDQFTDYGGTDLFSFFKETLNKNLKDRHILLKIEKDLVDLIDDESRNELHFPPASSYNRMLIHRTAAYFGLEHNVDAETQQCVIVAKTKNTRLPEISFKSLITDLRNEARKSILKRDTHSFDEVRQSSYLCPDRGMLDRKAKSFEEREEDYERARSRIFSRSHNDNADDMDNYMHMGWTNNSAEQHSNRNRSSGKILKMQASFDTRDGRSAGAVPKAHSFGGYGGQSGGNNAHLVRGESTNSNKIGGGNGRVFTKQDSAGSTNTPWRLSPSSSGSIYHFDPSNLPPSQAMAAGYHGAAHTNYMSSPINMKKHKQHATQPHHQHRNTPNNDTATPVDEQPQSVETTPETKPKTAAVIKKEEPVSQNVADECDNIPMGSLSVTTSTSTKNFDRIEVQKFKNQATSPNIPNDKEDAPKRENSSASSESSNQCDQNVRHTQPTTQPTATTTQVQHRETPHSSRSTPFSGSDVNAKRASEEPKPPTWSYTQSYQAPDGSTVFHTSATPSGNPYTNTTYQQGPDGSVYAIPQGMVYAYPPPVEGEVQGYFMPVFDPNQQRPDAGNIIPAAAAAQAIYPAAGGTATMVPVHQYTSQFPTNGTPIYPLYPSDQFTTAGPTMTTAPQANGQLQQIPMATYPIGGYPYAYNGYWGQTMTYYVPQQALTSAVAATPILSAAPPPPPPPTATVPGAHVANNVSNMSVTAAAGPSSNSTSVHSSGSSSGGSGVNNIASTGGGYHTHSGTTYYGTGRIKRPTPAHHFAAAQNNAAQIMAAIPSTGGTTATYQLGPAVPTLTLANPTAATNDLSATGTAPTAPMYALPQHTTLFPANMFPYAAAAAGPAAVHPTHTTTSTAAANHATTGNSHAQQPNAVITPIYTHGPPNAMHGHGHAPGPAAIPIVDPATMEHITGNNVHYSSNTNGVNGVSGAYVNGSNNSHSATSTPHSNSSQQIQRNPPVFSATPAAATGGSGNGNGNGNYSSNRSTPHYYAANVNSEQHNGNVASNSTHNAHTTSTYEKRTNNSTAIGGKKPPPYASSNNMSRQNANNSTVYNNGALTGNKPAILTSNNDTRASPNTHSNGYQGTRPHNLNKRGEKPSPLLSGPSGYSSSTPNAHQAISTDAANGKPPIRLNAAAASFRQKSNSAIEYRRSISQRNSPGTNNSSSNENSNNNSPSSIATSTTTTVSNCYVPAYINNSNSSAGNAAEQAHTTAPTTASLYIAARGTNHIPPPLAHGSTVVATTSGTAAMLGGTVAHHQPLLGAYNPTAGSGMYVKYGQTLFAHPSMTLQNTRRSPSTDIRPSMAQMAGMYPTVNMMIPAHPRHPPSRHPNPNYKGSRPR